MRRKHLLVIEDNKDIAETIQLVGHESGFNALVATEEREIRHYLKTQQPDVIVLDILMPDLDGFEVLQLLANYSSHAQIVILSDDENYLSMATRMGSGLGLDIVENLSKPIKTHQLRLIIQEIKLMLEDDSKLARGYRSCANEIAVS